MAKTKNKNHQPSEKWTKYTVKGDTVERKPTCPKCGPGYFFADHKDRYYCGNCHFMQMKTQ